MRLGKQLAFLFMVALGGCGTEVSTQVTRFDSLSSTPPGATFYVLPVEGQKSSAEFVHYANSLTRRLEQHGYRRTDIYGAADLVLFFDYGVGGARETVGAMPMYGQTSPGTTTYNSGTINTYGAGGSATGMFGGTSYTPPTYGITGYAPYSVTNYDRFFSMQIVDRHKSTRDRMVPVYEAKVTSSGSNANFAVVSECIFSAVFKNFRKTGSEHISLDMNSCN